MVVIRFLAGERFVVILLLFRFLNENLFTNSGFDDIIFAKRGSGRKEDWGMRTKLRQLGGQQRYQFTGTFKRTGFKKIPIMVRVTPFINQRFYWSICGVKTNPWLITCG